MVTRLDREWHEKARKEFDADPNSVTAEVYLLAARDVGEHSAAMMDVVLGLWKKYEEQQTPSPTAG